MNNSQPSPDFPSARDRCHKRDVRLSITCGHLAAGGKRLTKDIRIRKSRFVLGRAGTCHLVCRSRGVSHEHCVVESDGAGVFVRDLGSTNGTFLNGLRVRTPRRVRAGDRLRIGRIEFQFLMTPAAPDPKRQASDSFGESVAELLLESDEQERQWRALDPLSRYFQPQQADTRVEGVEQQAGKDVLDLKAVVKPHIGKLPPVPDIVGVDPKDAAQRAVRKMFDDSRKLSPGYR